MAQPFTVRVEGEPVVIPYRVYHAELEASGPEILSPLQRTTLACLYTRYHDVM